MAQVAAMKAAKTADQQSRAEQKAIFSVCFTFFMVFFNFFRFVSTFSVFFRLRNSSKASPMLECNFIQIFSGPEPAGVKKAFVYIRMNSSTGSNGPSGSNESGQNRRSTSRAEQKAIFFGLFYFYGFL